MPLDAEEIRASVRELFDRIARAPRRYDRTPIGPASARARGYDPRDIDALPASLTESFCGVANPLSLGEVRPGESVLDLGCGAGLDSILVARKVGPSGRVVGIDMTGAMVEKARRNAAALRLCNVRFFRARVEELPLGDGTVDVALCNGFYNLCPDKPKALAETFRVLKPGGRLLVADAFLEDHASPEEVRREGAWGHGIAGAVWVRSFLEMLAAAGFVDARFHGWTGHRTSDYTLGAHLKARKPVVLFRQLPGGVP